ncbi:MAG: hypothetical protein LLF98_01930 [Clostridium sp.]|uniref:hypothetical protein n=1 Tax=Clostridium sp. TaxID=1506 RepID=UPI0025C448AF|nr:hypothetical protein [Clostridium sp.]MCE5220040.1 hypothetical protein [Clostridium sp.]
MGLRRSLKITNLVVNGDFRNGTTGWTFGASVTDKTIVNGALTWTLPGFIGYTEDNWVSQNIIPSAGKYYIRLKAKRNNSVSNNQLLIGRSFWDLNVFDLSTEFRTYSKIWNCTGSGSLVFGASEITNGLNVNIDDVFLINLTDIFGVGNEPMQAQCDIWFANWFDGTLAERIMGRKGGLH